MTTLYTFLDEDGKMLEQVLADNHDKALAGANGWSDKGIDFQTDFYSETFEDDSFEVGKIVMG